MAYGSRFAKKAMGKAKRYAKKRYLRKGAGYGTGLRLNKLSKDILLIKSKLNTEKKYIDTGEVATQGVGQCNANNIGNYCVDITPTPASGSGFSQRTGKSIKAVAMCLEYQLVQQANCVGPRRFKLFIGQTVGTPIPPLGANSIQTNFLEANPITTMIDYNSNRDINFFQRFKVLACKKIYLKDDSIASQAQITTGKIAMKLNHHIQFDDNTTTVTNGQLFWFIVADAGNWNSSVDSTLANVAVTGNQTGASFQTYTRFWYVDN